MLDYLKQFYRFLNPKFQNAFLDYKVDLKPRFGHGMPPHSKLYNLISAHDSTYKNYLQDALNHKDVFAAFGHTPNDANLPHFNNGFFPGLDIIALYTLLAKFKPNSFVEVGSGNSTRVAFKSKLDNKLDTKIISIDPFPRVEIDQLADQIFRVPFEKFDLSFFQTLTKGDFVFIDNSHRIFSNSDANVFFLEVLPLLNPGVIVHVHDVYLPYDYPQFMCDRYYNEQYGLAYFLLANPDKFIPIFPAYYISENPNLNYILNPIWDLPNLLGVEKHGGSFYFKIAEV